VTTLDWGSGSYEKTAERLLPTAHVVIEHAAPSAGERVVDLGCGTGNAAFLAAERGAHVTGVDPTGRLLDVARDLAAERGLEADFAEGDAANIPLGEGEADLIVSVFGVIFAPDPEAAAAEMARVAAADGRIVLSAWIPEGPIMKVVRAMGEATRGEPQLPPFAWHDPEALSRLLGPHGFDVAMQPERIAFRAESAEAYFDEESRTHPPWFATRAELEPRGEFDLLRERVIEILEAENEDTDSFRVTSPYAVATARRR
jgi:SAM-dependent methyltransferase